MPTNSELQEQVSDAINQAVSGGIARWREGQQEFQRYSLKELLDAQERLEARAAEDAGARTFLPMVEFND